MKMYYIDLFCGAGGTSTGVSKARYNGVDCAEVIACVNHDKNAIASHLANHPNTLHFTEDIRTLDIAPLVGIVSNIRKTDTDAVIVLWASLECTNFSKAKGGKPRDADSRTLAEHLFRYIDGIQPDYIQIENVEEFMAWGDVDESGHPISMDKMPPYLMTTESGDMAIAVYDTDSPMTKKIKQFMAMYSIIDIKMRMLKVNELKKIMGFPEDYVLVGTQSEQKKYIGNAVEVNMAKVLCEALYEALYHKAA